MIWKFIAFICSRKSVATWLISRSMRTPYTNITSSDGKQTYMRRWWLFNPYPIGSSGLRPRWQFPINVRVHHILRADQDRDLHDHPWNARTIILRGWYVEERIDQVEISRNTGSTATLNFGEYHRIDRVSPGGVFTLFITGKYRGTWGFLVNGLKVQWRKYLGVDQ